MIDSGATLLVVAAVALAVLTALVLATLLAVALALLGVVAAAVLAALALATLALPALVLATVALPTLALVAAGGDCTDAAPQPAMTAAPAVIARLLRSPRRLNFGCAIGLLSLYRAPANGWPARPC